MNVMLRQESTGNRLTDIHATAFDTVAHLYDEQNPTKLETYQRRAELVAGGRSESRRAVVETLSAFMGRVGANSASQAQLQRLLDDRSVAVVTGQQAGLFTGPMYSVYKALSAIGLAKRLEADLGRPVVPVFWIASEDHDWAEVNHAYVVDALDEVKRVQYRADAPLHQMVYHQPLEEAAVLEVLKQLADSQPDTLHKAEMMETLRELWKPGDTLSTWFARQLYHFLGNHGLVMLDPCLPGLRQLVKPVWRQALTRHQEVERQLQVVYGEVGAAGFTPGVVRDHRNTTLFYVHEGKRYVLERTDDDTLLARSYGLEQTVEKWLELVERSPESFSSNVLLRPVVQDELLPTLAYVGGPAEVAYHALSRGVFHAHGRTLPPLIMRQRATLYSTSVMKVLDRRSMAKEDVFQPTDLLRPLLQEFGVEEIEHAFAKMRAESARRWQSYTEAFERLGPQVADMARVQERRDERDLDRLLHKTVHLLTTRHATEVRQVRHVERWLWTDGHAQERRLAPVSFWARYGTLFFKDIPAWGDYETPLASYHIEI